MGKVANLVPQTARNQVRKARDRHSRYEHRRDERNAEHDGEHCPDRPVGSGEVGDKAVELLPL